MGLGSTEKIGLTTRFIEGEDRSQFTLLPECLDDYIGEDNPVRVVDVFIDEIDLPSQQRSRQGTECETMLCTPSHVKAFFIVSQFLMS